jgi:hypothetical protein
VSIKNGTTPKSSTASNTHADGTARQPGEATPNQLADPHGETLLIEQVALTDWGVHSVALVLDLLIDRGVPADAAAGYLMRLAATPGSVLPVRGDYGVELLIRPEPGSGGQLRLLVAPDATREVMAGV